FDPAEQEAARQVLLRLVTLGEGTKDIRRRVLRQELTGLGDPAVGRVLDVLDRHRFLSFDRDPVTRGPTVEIAHEALLTEWARLRAWIDESRDDVRNEQRLAAAAAEWSAANRDPELLLRGSRLDQVASWAAESAVAVASCEQAYLQASLRSRREEQAAEA